MNTEPPTGRLPPARKATQQGDCFDLLSEVEVFRVLGAVEVWFDGAPVKIGGACQRALLALLLLSANRLVARGQLMDDFLGDARGRLSVAYEIADPRFARVLARSGAGVTD